LDVGQRDQLRLAMTALAAGDRSAFKPVFSSLWPILRRFCERALRDPDTAHDAAQTALTKLLLHATDYRAGGDGVAASSLMTRSSPRFPPVSLRRRPLQSTRT